MEQAVESSGVKIRLEWEPFLLNPDMEDEGEDLKEHITNKYGASAAKGFGDPNSNLFKSGRAVGINFTSDRNIYPTASAHALMEHVKLTDNDKANKLMETMYEEYFCKGVNINSVDVLADIATKLEIDKDKAVAVCSDKELQKQVKIKDRKFKTSMGISGVPFFIIQPNKGGRPFGFSGAQPAEIIAEQLEMAAKE